MELFYFYSLSIEFTFIGTSRVDFPFLFPLLFYEKKIKEVQYQKTLRYSPVLYMKGVGTQHEKRKEKTKIQKKGGLFLRLLS